MACTLNIVAPNGSTSNLFKDIARATSNPKDAVDTYYYTKTEEFKNAYKGTRDENGEPVYEQFSTKEYVDDIDYTTVEMDASAEAIKDLMDTIPRAISIVEDRLKFLDRSEGKYRDKNIEDLEELLVLLENSPMERSIPKLLKLAHFHVKGLRESADKEKLKKDYSIKKLANIYNVSQTYSVVNDMRAIINNTPEVEGLFKGKLFKTEDLTDNILSIQNSYIDKSIHMLTEEFHKRNNTWSKRDITKALKNSPIDLKLHEQMLGYIGDSSDPVLSMVARIMMEAEQTIRHESIEFSKELTTVLTALEKKYPDKKSDIFESLIVEADNGELHYVHPEAKHTNGKNAFSDRMYNKLQKIKGDKEMMDFLMLFHNTMQGAGASIANMGTRLPSVLKGEFELLEGKSLKEKAGLIQTNMKNKILRSNTDLTRGEIVDGTGKPLDKIPVFYTQKYNSIDYDNYYKQTYDALIESGKSKQDADKIASNIAEKEAIKEFSKHITRDLSASIQAWHNMALNYATKKEMLHIFDAATIVVEKGRTYNKVEGGVTKLIKGTTTPVSFKEGSYAAKHLRTFLEMQLYGQTHKDLSYVNIFGAKVDWNAIYRQIGSFTSFNMLAVNMLAATGNFFNGEYNNVMEAVGGEHYNVSQYHKATKVYTNDLAGILEDIGQRVPTSFVSMMEEKYDMLQNYGENKIKTSERSRIKRMLKTNLVFFMNSSGEHFMQIRGSMAVMEGIKAYDSNGNELGSLLDMHTKENDKIVVKQGTHIKDSKGNLVLYDKNQENRIGLKMNAVMRYLQGNYSGRTANAMQQDGRTSLLMKFRGWMHPGIMRRFQGKRDHHLLENELEGFYVGGSKVLLQLGKDLSKLKFQLAKENWANLSPAEKANVRRLITEVSMITATGVASVLIGNMGKMVEDEFDSDSTLDRAALGAYQMLVYQTNRLHTEIFAYVNPVEAVRLMKSPMASMSLIENTIKLIEQSIHPTERYESGWRKGDLKLGVRLEKLIPIYKQIMTFNPNGIKDRGIMYNM